jgi:hypothetical protein
MRVVVTRRYDQPDPAVCPFSLVDLQETFSKRVESYPYYGVGVGVEVRPPTEGLGRDRVLLNLMGAAGKALFANVLQHPCQID